MTAQTRDSVACLTDDRDSDVEIPGSARKIAHADGGSSHSIEVRRQAFGTFSWQE
jgi:hypothetical protein